MLKHRFDGKVEVSIATGPDDLLQADASYFTSISGKDILDKDYIHDVEDGSICEQDQMLSNESMYAVSNVNTISKAEESAHSDSVRYDSTKSGNHSEIKFAISSNASGISRNFASLNPTDKPGSHLAASFSSQEFDPVRNTWVTTKADKAQLRNSGLKWRTGKWTDEETELLKRNISQYCLDHNIDDPRDIIYNASKEDRPHFYPTVAAGLNRPVFSVYRRVKRMYDAQNYRGKYSPEEVEKLKTLYKKYGRDWTSIGNEMGRSSDSVKDRCRLVTDGIYKPGKWSEDEEIRLAQAVYSYAGVEEGTSVTSGICWITVANTVGSRNQKQCRAKWLNYLNWKMSKGEKWTKTSDAELLHKIIDSGVSSEEEIDWKKLSMGWKSSRSPQWLRIKWWSLKQYYLHEFPNIGKIAFNDLLQALSKMITEQLQNTWDSKRSRKPFGQAFISSRKIQEPPTKIAKLHPEPVKPLWQEGNRRTKDITLIYSDTPASSIAADKLVYVSSSKPDIEKQVLFENDDDGTKDMLPMEQETETNLIKDDIGYFDTAEHNTDVPISVDDDITVPMNTTIELTPTSTPGVYLFQNTLMLVLSQDMNNVEFGPPEDSIIDPTENASPPNDDIASNHSDIITTSDVLVYQETGNDDDIKNSILSSTLHEVGSSSANDNEEDSCFMQSSSPLQGTLLEGTDLAAASLRMDEQP